MSLFNHILVATCYILVAVAVAIALPYGFPAIDMNAAIVLGGVLLVGAALLHEVFSRQEVESKFADELQMLRLEQGDARRELDQARNRFRNLQRSMDQVVEEHKAIAGKHRDVDKVVAEVKVLQGLIEQLSTRTTGQAMPAAGGGDARPAALAAGPVRERSATPPQVPAVSAVPAVPAVPGAAGVPGRPELDLNDEEILKLVRDGLEGNRVDLVLQPVVSLPQRRLKFYEAYTRIRDGQGAVLTPSQYIAIAEREGLISAIDNMLLFRCVQLVRQAQQRQHNIGFFCNISAHSLTDRHFFNNFVEFMGDNAGLASNLIFEFAQSTIVDRDAEVEASLRHLASLGFRFSIDQVASLNLEYDELMRNHIKFVKIEAGLLLNEMQNPTGAIAVNDIKRMFDRHGIDLVVEKIESEPDLLNLLDCRIDYGQGYLFGEPRVSRTK